MTEEFIGEGDEAFIEGISNRILNTIEAISPPLPAVWSDEKRIVIVLAGIAAVVAGLVSCGPDKETALTAFNVSLQEFLKQLEEMEWTAKESTDDRE